MPRYTFIDRLRYKLRNGKSVEPARIKPENVRVCKTRQNNRASARE